MCHEFGLYWMILRLVADIWMTLHIRLAQKNKNNVEPSLLNLNLRD